MAFKVAILTVSDTAANDPDADRSGPVARSLITQHGFELFEARIVPDEEKDIRRTVKAWCHSEEVHWVITTGGTGFGKRDRTPEAVTSLIDREAPGIVHLLLSSSLEHTPLAALSRPVAGTVRDTLVVTLPGSPKAVKENLEALLKAGLINHALDLITGGSGKAVHARLQAGGNGPGLGLSEREHHHHHYGAGHDHEIPKSRTQFIYDADFPLASRNRVSPYPLISYEQALVEILRETRTIGIDKKQVTTELKGHVLADDVYAPHDLPSSRTTNVDGYALRSTDPPGIYQVLTAETHEITDVVPYGYVYRVNTGAPLPAGTDSVIMVEDTALVTTRSDNSEEEKEIRTLAQVTPGENTRAPGSDTRKGELVLQSGSILSGTGGEIGTLVFVGCKEVSVYRKPRVALMSTGNELVDIQGSAFVEGFADSKEKWSGIFDTNRPSLRAVVESMGYEVVDLGIVKDNLDSHADTLFDGLQRADIVITTGGTSMGASDLLKPVIERRLQGTIHFGRVTIKPGKPTTFATVPVLLPSRVSENPLKVDKPIFALPGNPASALVCFYIFVLPALRNMGGWPRDRCQLPRVPVTIASTMPLDPRTEFHRVVITASPEGLKATSTGGQRSSRVASLSGANGLVILPQKKDGGPKELVPGELAAAIVIGEIQLEHKV